MTANNGVFTRAINSHLLTGGATVAYTFRFTALRGGAALATEELSVTAQSAEPCLITSVPTQTEFDTCFASQILNVRVAHSPGDEIDSVWVNLLSGSNVLTHKRFSAAQADTVWRYTLTPAFFRCANGAGLSLVYGARTRFGFACEQTVNAVSYTNALPVLSELEMPDTAYRPMSSDTVNLVFVSIHLADCELAGDTSFTGLRFDVSRDDTLHWTPDASFTLRDNGLEPDVTPGDGVYSNYFQVPHSSTNLNNEYYFRFYAVDGLVGTCTAPLDTSAFAYDSVRVIQPAGALHFAAPSMPPQPGRYPVLR